MIVTLWVAAAGAVGAPARFALDGWLQGRSRTAVPVGTLSVNLSGAFVLGVVTGLIAHGQLSATVGTALSAGLLGGFTTFSTFSFESVRLAEEAKWRPLAVYLTVTLVGGLVAAGLGLAVASAIA